MALGFKVVQDTNAYTIQEPQGLGKNFGLKYTMHQEIGLTPSPTCPLPGKVVSAKAGCGRSGNKAGFQPRVSPPRRRTEGGFFI